MSLKSTGWFDTLMINQVENILMDNAQLTQLLNNNQSALNDQQQQDIAEVYQRLKEIAKIQRVKVKGSSLNTTALVNEAWLKSQHQNKTFNDRNHFFAYSALAMRHILLNEAKKNRLLTFVEQPDELNQQVLKESDYLIDLDRALERLKAFNADLEQVFTYKFFGDMEFTDIAEVMQVSERTVFRNWKKARAMLAVAMQ